MKKMTLRLKKKKDVKTDLSIVNKALGGTTPKKLGKGPTDGRKKKEEAQRLDANI